MRHYLARIARNAETAVPALFTIMAEFGLTIEQSTDATRVLHVGDHVIAVIAHDEGITIKTGAPGEASVAVVYLDGRPGFGSGAPTEENVEAAIREGIAAIPA